MAEEDTVTVDDHTILDEENLQAPNVGGTLFSSSDPKSVGEKLSTIESLLRDELNRERDYYDTMGKSAIRVNPNMSGECQFRRYGLTAGQTAVMIVKEKRDRGNVIITLNDVAVASVSIGRHSGIMLGGLDTVTIWSGTTIDNWQRTIRTRNELWAVASADCVIDIQEEYD